jgi:hypothetical protein
MDAKPSLWLRLLRAPLTLLILGFVLILLAQVGAFLVKDRIEIDLIRDGVAAAPLLAAVPYVAIVVLAYWLFVHFVEGAPFRDFAPHGAARELGLGLALGAGLMSAIVAIMALIGVYRVTGFGAAASLYWIAGLSLTSGVGEEILARGIIFRQIERGLGSVIALAISALLFGFAHIANPGSSWFAALAIALEAGILLGAVYMATRRLWAAIGVHAAWNFFQGGVYGVPVSGLKAVGLLVSVRNGPALLTGGAFGAEASLVALVVATAAGLLILRFAWRRGQWVHPFWTRRRRAAALQKGIRIDIDGDPDRARPA